MTYNFKKMEYLAILFEQPLTSNSNTYVDYSPFPRWKEKSSSFPCYCSTKNTRSMGKIY